MARQNKIATITLRLIISWNGGLIASNRAAITPIGIFRFNVLAFAAAQASVRHRLVIWLVLAIGAIRTG
jgi:hypothetical protein